MRLAVGQTLESVVDATAVVVVRCPDQEIAITCGGHAMVAGGEAGEPVPAVDGAGHVGLALGKRYTVEGVDVELLCVRAGDSTVAVDGVGVVQKTAKPLPASD